MSTRLTRQEFLNSINVVVQQFYRSTYFIGGPNLEARSIGRALRDSRRTGVSLYSYGEFVGGVFGAHFGASGQVTRLLPLEVSDRARRYHMEYVGTVIEHATTAIIQHFLQEMEPDSIAMVQQRAGVLDGERIEDAYVFDGGLFYEDRETLPILAEDLNFIQYPNRVKAMSAVPSWLREHFTEVNPSTPEEIIQFMTVFGVQKNLGPSPEAERQTAQLILQYR